MNKTTGDSCISTLIKIMYLIAITYAWDKFDGGPQDIIGEVCHILLYLSSFSSF